MKAEQFNAIMDKLRAACAKPPTDAQYDVLVESITDNRLTDAEIMRGYQASRDAAEPWFPRPGEFLARARPPANIAAIGAEADTILQAILDHPTRYGRYNPETGTVWDRRIVEARHGRAAGEAFGSIQGRLRTMESLADEKWVRKAFSDAYEAARRDYGAPATLTPPERRLEPGSGFQALTGASSESGKQDEPAAGDQERRLSELIHGPATPTPAPVDWDARRAELRRQAEELGAGA